MKWVFVWLVLMFGIAQAQSQKELQEVQKKLSEKKEELKKVESKRKNIIGNLHEIEKRKEKLEKTLKDTQSQIAKKDHEIDSTLEKINATKSDMVMYKSFMKAHFQHLYMHGSVNVLKTFFEKMDMDQRRQQNVLIKHWVEREKEKLVGFNEMAVQLQNQANVLAAQRQQQQKLYEESQKNISNLEAEQKKRKHLLASVMSQKDLYQQSIRELEEASRKLETMISNFKSTPLPAHASSFEKAIGLLRHPVDGKIAKGFGSFDDQTLKTKVHHKGIDFVAPMGAKVTSIYAGKVAFAGWFEGYGKVVIIDHGSHYYSLYAHLSEIEVQNAQTVEAGKIIGQVGDSGSLKGAHLYFELRKQGVTINPHPWFA